MKGGFSLQSLCGSEQNSALEWLLYNGCLQRLIVSAVQLLFLLVFLGIFLQKAASRLLSGGSSTSSSRSASRKGNEQRLITGKIFIATLVIAALVTLIYVAFEAWLLWLVISHHYSGALPSVDIIFTSFQAVKWLIFVTIVGHEKKFGALLHPLVLRIWWIVDFVLSSLLLASAVLNLSATDPSFTHRYVIEILSVVSFPASLFLLALGVRGRTGIVLASEEVTGLREPLLSDRLESSSGYKVTTPYVTASIFNRAVWKWLTPLLDEGYKRQLQISDVPQLALEERVEHNHALFKQQWPDDHQNPGAHPVRSTLFKCFGRRLLQNGLLALIRLCVMYAGPALIQRFVDFTSGNGSGSPYEGYYLVLILLVAKCIEVLASHHFNFQSQKLGMVVRSTVVAEVYQKGLRLSSASKQGHGVGHIVNYMVVDAAQLSDLIFQLHNLWLLPAQVCIALVILYNVLGLPMLAGVVVMVLVIAFNFYCTQKQKQYQGSVMYMRDQRMKATSEVLNFMKIIKFQAWEDHFINQIERYRNSERLFLSKFLFLLGQSLVAMWIIGPLVAMVTFGACVLVGVELTPSNVFTAITTFRILQEPVRNFPQALISIAQSLVSLERLDKFMVSDERDTGAVEQMSPGSKFAIQVDHGNFSWEEQVPTLKDINVDVRKGQLVTIVGTVGSGKSSLLTAVLGEMRKLSGTVKVSGSTAYVSQTAWVQNATVEDNILFGLPMNRTKYTAAIRACALVDDLKLMEFGDQTEIGERGINLSGGQKQRIQLARAVYQDADIYLLDDVFSAVDAHTGTHLFQECILGSLRGKTVLLVTHQVEFLHGADLILVMRDGVIVQSGKYDEILTKGTDLEELVAAHHTAMESINMDDQEPAADGAEAGSPQSNKQLDKRLSSLKRKPSISVQKQLKASSKLIDEEQRELGRVNWRVYWLYFSKAFGNFGWMTLPSLLILQAACTVLTIASDYWLAHETSEDRFNPNRFLEVFFILNMVSWILVTARVALQMVAGLKTAQILYSDMLRCIFSSPMSFFDTTPSGRVLSRSSSDQVTVDVFLPIFSGTAIGTIISAVGSLAVTCQVTWPIIFLVVPLIWIFFYYQNFYLTTSRELTRLDSITRAPIIFHFSETLNGLVTIRAFKKEESFVRSNVDRVNTNCCMDFHNNAANEWLGFRLEMIGTTLLCATALLLVTLPASVIAPEKVGLSLSYGLSLNSIFFWSVWLLCMLENKMVSVERIRQYTTIESEAPRINEAYRPPPKWPTNGTISIQNLQLRYRPNTPLVLRGVSLRIQGGSKVGVVGRTGSGKSTLIQAFFRLVEPCAGHIFIDDLDITKLGLADLRSKFGIIPQEPILFEGSVRSNVDPLGQYTDNRIWEVLRKCQLADSVEQKAGGLDSTVSESGDNWSVGQKQLFCLGRALLKESRILFLDEATASVDAQTDAIIQRTIKEQFAASTVISVAHRIPSVMDSDKVLVMGEGEAKEYDRPSVLLERPSSLFGALVREYTSRSGAS